MIWQPKPLILPSAVPMAATSKLAQAGPLLVSSRSSRWGSLGSLSWLQTVKLWKLWLKQWIVNLSTTVTGVVTGSVTCSASVGGLISQSPAAVAVLVTVKAAGNWPLLCNVLVQSTCTGRLTSMRARPAASRPRMGPTTSQPKPLILPSAVPMAATSKLAQAGPLLVSSRSSRCGSLGSLSWLQTVKLWKLWLKQWIVNVSTTVTGVVTGSVTCSASVGGLISQSPAAAARLVTGEGAGDWPLLWRGFVESTFTP